MSFHLVCELLERMRTMRSYHVVLSSIMMLSFEMREMLKIDVDSPLSKSMDKPWLDSRHKSKQRRVNINTFIL